MTSPEEVLALHRCFLQASQMRAYYDHRLATDGAAPVENERWSEQWIDLCLWYACLYVVHSAFSRWFLDWFDARRASTA